MSASDPLPLDLLVADHQRRLNEATGSTKPLPASTFEECLDLVQRQAVSVEAQERFQRSLAQPCARFDEIDYHMAADPVLDRLPAYRSGRDADRLTSILDSLDGGEG